MGFLYGFLVSLQLLAGCLGLQCVTPETLPPPVPVQVSGISSREAAAGTQSAEEITDGVSVAAGEQNLSRLLLDNAHMTKFVTQPGIPIQLDSQVPFRNLYIKWETLPGPYTLQWDGGSLVCGTDGFLYEYIRLPQDITSLEILLPEEPQTLCDIRLFTGGDDPEDVQIWLPPCQEADILLFPTHSDDDVLFFGPLISYYAIERQLTVQTAFMVEHVYEPHRLHERLDGLWAMGVRHYPILGNAPDTGSHNFYFGMSFYADSNIEQWQVEQIRRFRPLVVVGHDIMGEYGNAGHRVNTHYLLSALESAADPEAFPQSAARYGTWDIPKLYLHLYRENEIILDVNTPMSRDPEGRTPFQIAQDAFGCHHSQNKHGMTVQQGTSLYYDCRPFGLYRSRVGADTGADIMENIRKAFIRLPRETYLPSAME